MYFCKFYFLLFSQVVANAGDMVYFPKGVFISFTSPDWGLGFYVGQRVGDTA